DRRYGGRHVAAAPRLARGHLAAAMSRTGALLALAIVLWAALVAVGLAARPPLPVDETRYLGVAWEMWQRGDFLVPHINGIAYHHKPPLLFWLMQAGWAVFGVSEIW